MRLRVVLVLIGALLGGWAGTEIPVKAQSCFKSCGMVRNAWNGCGTRPASCTTEDIKCMWEKCQTFESGCTSVECTDGAGQPDYYSDMCVDIDYVCSCYWSMCPCGSGCL